MSPKLEKSEKKLISKVEELTLQTEAFKRYLPERVVEKILLNPGSAKVEGEHRLVTVLFADLSGFTHLSEELSKQGKKGAEEITEIVNNYFTKMLDIVSKYGGTVDKFMGDAILVLFGAPVAHEDDPERAVRAAIDMQSAMKVFESMETSQGIFSLQMSVGINTGLVVAGNVGSEKRMEYTVMGDNVNLAARLEQRANAGEILISETTYEKVKEIFDMQALSPEKVKGKDKPVQMYRVLRFTHRYHQEKIHSITGAQLKMIGREKEVALLEELWKKSLSGKGQIVSIIGDAGIGKTRLNYEFRNKYIRPGTSLWLEGKSLSYGASMLYWVIIDLLRVFFQIEDTNSKETIKEKISLKLSELGIEKYIPFVCNLFSITFPDSILEYLDAKAIKQNTFDAVRNCFILWSQKEPTILVFDDFHWIDSASLELLQHILLKIGDARIFIICSWRKTERDLAKMFKHENYTELHLSELSHPETESFAKSILDSDALPAELKKFILEKSGGNPLYLEELLNSLIEKGALKKTPSSEGWRLVSKISDLEIPDTIEGIVMSRLDNLDEKVKSVVQTASVIGKRFHYQILKHVSETYSGGAQDLNKCLNMLTEKDILYKEFTKSEAQQ